MNPPFSETSSLVQPDDPAISSIVGMDATYLREELDVSRLKEIQSHLWRAGRSGKGSTLPLHQQAILGRELIVTERADLHLVWRRNRIFIKPLPRYLMNHDFFKSYLCGDEDLHKDGCGLLYSYGHLVQHQSDLKIAIQLELLPPDTRWEKWIVFSREVLAKVGGDTFKWPSHRYAYGELHLGWLDWIRMRNSYEWYQKYHNTHSEYRDFFRKNSTWVGAVFQYLTVAFAAMQVLLAALQDPQGGFVGGFCSVFSYIVLGVMFIAPLLIAIWSGYMCWSDSQHDSQEAARAAGAGDV